MPKIILDDAVREQLTQNGGPTELCDRNGHTVAIALAPEEFRRLMYDLAWAEFSTPESQARQDLAMEQYRRGEYVTSEQLVAELRQRGYMPRVGE
jgi:hypothetical protein